jgi:hypothetical protein
MKLNSFSIQRYRSIQKAEKLPLGDLAILVGPNNEGKSNILRGLVVGMELLGLGDRLRLVRGRARGTATLVSSQAGRSRSEGYVWDRDFPLPLQASHPEGTTIFDFEFELTGPEVEDFRSEIKSSLNGTLPIRLTIGPDSLLIQVRKKGPGAKALTEKRDRIARFVASRINLEYIRSVRTARDSMRVVGEMVGRELRGLESSSEYQNAVAVIARLQEPILGNLSETVTAMLKTFLPEVSTVEIQIPSEERFSALRRDSQIIVDDGTPTALEQKGDGIQSLAAVSLIQHVSEQAAGSRQLILAIEEPEAHLHPRAIHQLTAVLRDIASKQQVILTTHSPLLVNRFDIGSNIIVENSRARAAGSVKELRQVLGVRTSDNLESAELVLILEGESDRTAMRALLPVASTSIAEAMSENALAIETLLGGSNLGYKLSQLRESLCVYHAFLDKDQAGVSAAARAEAEGLLEPADRQFATCPGMTESELEDLYDPDVYKNVLLTKYNVDVSDRSFRRAKAKWTVRVQRLFHASGQVWDDQIAVQVKSDVARVVTASPETSLHSAKRSAFDALVGALERKLTAAPQP